MADRAKLEEEYRAAAQKVAELQGQYEDASATALLLSEQVKTANRDLARAIEKLIG